MDQNARTLEEKAAELARCNRELETFAQIVAHDLREPLRSIRLIASFLQEDVPGMDEATASRVARLAAIAERAERLVGALLDHARVGNTALRRANHGLAEIVADATQALSARLTEADGEVEIITALPVVSCDRVLLSQVFANLIDNGLKFNRAERRKVQIGAADPESNSPSVFVRDNGIGMDPGNFESLSRIFARPLPAPEFGGGAGAGLAIVRRIIERHGGTIRVESSPGGGTTFWISLPRDRGSEQGA